MGVTVIAKSIISNERECFVCHDTRVLHKHHIYPGLGRREMSEHFGLWVYLCPRHHNYPGSPVAVHGGYVDGKAIDRRLKELGQKKFEETHTRAEWHRYFGRSYLEEDENE